MSKVDDFIYKSLNEAARRSFEDVETIEEKQLIALLMIRNNLRDQGDDLKTIRNIVSIFGLIVILVLILGGCNLLTMF